MIYLLISILCSVTVGVLFKLAKRYRINIVQAITWNYLFAILLTLLLFKPQVENIGFHSLTGIHYGLGLLMPSLFIVLGLAVRHAGLARTDIAQRLSLLIALVAAFFMFKESSSLFKIAGLLIGFAAIGLILYKEAEQTWSKQAVFFLLLVFGGFGIADILFKKLSQYSIIPYTDSLFVIYFFSFVLALLYMFYRSYRHKERLQLINFICGLILGFFNFGNILFYLKAHQHLSDNPSLVFAVMNMGVILLGSLLGIFIFKERFNRLNYVGLFLALIAIVVISLSKIYAI